MTPPGHNRPSLPQRLPASLTYNDLNGDEAVEILTDWFRQLLKGHYLMQPHLTLPMAVLDLRVSVGVDMYVGGTVPVASPPDHIDIQGSVKLNNEVPVAGYTASNDRNMRAEHAQVVVASHTEHDFATTVNVAPMPGGLPPDQVREQHRLPVPRPGYGSRDTGSHLFLADIPDVDADVAAEAKRVFTAQLADPIVRPYEPDASDEVKTARVEVSASDCTAGRAGIVDASYVMSSEPVVNVEHVRIAVDNGSIGVNMNGQPVQHAGISVSAGTHVSSKKELGDQKGHAYESVNGVLDAGPRGLMRPGRGAGGLYTDGRPRLSFGNGHRGS